MMQPYMLIKVDFFVPSNAYIPSQVSKFHDYTQMLFQEFLEFKDLILG